MQSVISIVIMGNDCWVILCQTTTFQKLVMKVKILNVMDVYLLSNLLFCRVGSKCNFHLRFGTSLQEGTNDFRKMAASLCYFHTEISRSVSKICSL